MPVWRQSLGFVSLTVDSFLELLGVSFPTHRSRCPNRHQVVAPPVCLCEHADVTECCRAHLLSAECWSVLHAGAFAMASQFASGWRAVVTDPQHAPHHVNTGEANTRAAVNAAYAAPRHVVLCDCELQTVTSRTNSFCLGRL